MGSYVNGCFVIERRCDPVFAHKKHCESEVIGSRKRREREKERKMIDKWNIVSGPLWFYVLQSLVHERLSEWSLTSIDLRTFELDAPRSQNNSVVLDDG